MMPTMNAAASDNTDSQRTTGGLSPETRAELEIAYRNLNKELERLKRILGKS